MVLRRVKPKNSVGGGFSKIIINSTLALIGCVVLYLFMCIFSDYLNYGDDATKIICVISFCGILILCYICDLDKRIATIRNGQ